MSRLPAWPGMPPMITAKLADYIAASGTRTLPEAVRQAAIHHLVDTSRRSSREARSRRGPARSPSSASSPARSRRRWSAPTSWRRRRAPPWPTACSPMPTNPTTRTASRSRIRAARSSRRRSRSARVQGEFRRRIPARHRHRLRCRHARRDGARRRRLHGALSSLLVRRDFRGGSGIGGAARPRRRRLRPRPSPSRVHLASGSTCWVRDPAHVEKAFVFGGLPAHNGVKAALLRPHRHPGLDRAARRRARPLCRLWRDLEPAARDRGARRALRDHAHGDQEVVRRLAGPGRARFDRAPARGAPVLGRRRRRHSRDAAAAAGADRQQHGAEPEPRRTFCRSSSSMAA